MPTTRKRVRRVNDRIELNDMVRVHVELGDCLIAGTGKGCGCGLRDYDGHERDDLVREMQARINGESHGHK